MKFVDRDAITPVPEGTGITRRTPTAGDRLMLVEVTFDEDVTAGGHNHVADKTGYVVSRRLGLGIGEESRDLSPGDAWLVPAGVVHEASTHEPTVIVEAFSPARGERR